MTQWTLGIFLGTFSYCMAALPAARSLPHPFAPVATVLGAMVLALACVGWLLFFIHHISQAISVNHIVDRIATETEAVIDEMMPWPHWPERLQQTHVAAADAGRGCGGDAESGYIRFIDTRRLLELAKQYRRADSRAAAGGSFCSGGDSAGDGREGGAARRRRESTAAVGI